MKTSINHSNLNKFYDLQSKCDSLREKVENSDTVYFKGHAVDKQRLADILSSISGCIEELYEFTCF